MVKGKDFYGGTVTDAIAEACEGFASSQEELNIEILETGSSGIFGLCRKKAHIRVTKKNEESSPDKELDTAEEPAQPCDKTGTERKAAEPKVDAAEDSGKTEEVQKTARKGGTRKNGKKPAPKKGRRPEADLPPPEPPSDEILTEIQEDITGMLNIMGFPSTVTVIMKNHTVACH
ncbi:MAG: hypothetical protein D3910_27590, partial [Candidatus Electrothrix sp. ATG2]|nr:hypothetical protein [Candidatus Electrothrix sp. ATG2]